MTHVLLRLRQYKMEVFKQVAAIKQKKFLNNLFAVWMCSSIKSDVHEFAPNVDFVTFNIDNLMYANDKLGLKFDIEQLRLFSAQQYCMCIGDITAQLYDKIDQPPIIKDNISEQQHKRLYNLYVTNNGHDKGFEARRDELLMLYEFMGTSNIHLGIPPIFKGVELFGSPLNTHNDLYCSPFKIESAFGSLGSFFEYTFHADGLYLCNPPFSEDVIKQMALRLVQILDETEHSVVVVVTVPVWDQESQKKISGAADVGLDFEGYRILHNSTHRRCERILDQSKYPYYNYFTDQRVPATYSHVLVLSNTDVYNFSLSGFLRRWRKWASSPL